MFPLFFLLPLPQPYASSLSFLLFSASPPFSFVYLTACLYSQARTWRLLSCPLIPAVCIRDKISAFKWCEAPFRVLFHSWHREGAKMFPLDWSYWVATAYFAWKEGLSCTHQVAEDARTRVSKTSRKWLQRREGNADGVQYHANYISRMGLFSYGIV